MNKDTVSFYRGPDAVAIIEELTSWQKENKVARLWAGDTSLWTHSEENKWMGWLDVAPQTKEVSRIRALADEIKAAGMTDIVLLGMGGSSLCPAMMAEIFGKIGDYPRLHILDSTDPMQIRHLEDRIDLKNSFFIVSSKSGSTLEPNIFKDYFYSRMQTVLDKTEVGDRFIAITDPGTSLEELAQKNHFKAVFHGIPSIGGRYSALSNFGMVPSGLMGVDINQFLQSAEAMRLSCSPDTLVQDNPGVALGVILGVSAKLGKDKVTLIVSPGIHSLGSWLEQLLAESTGKNGKGLIPVDEEMAGAPSVYGTDRVFIYIRLESAPDAEQDRAVDVLEQSNFVVVRLTVLDKMHLGAELFRWLIATPVAGSILGIDPFNQPDVEESKVLSLRLADQYEKTGHIQQPSPCFSAAGISLFADKKNEQDITNGLRGAPSLQGYLRSHLMRIRANDYLDFSAFIEMSNEHIDLLQESRLLIRDNKKVATCLGFGPRFLHSTGQDYKGGPNTGVFLQITADYRDDIEVPGHRYTFGFVIGAQAQADFSVLTARGRRALRIHLGEDVDTGLRTLHELIQEALS